MKLRQDHIVLTFFVALLAASCHVGVFAQGSGTADPGRVNVAEPDTSLPFPIEVEDNFPFSSSNSSPLYLQTPSNITTEIEYDTESNSYILSEKVGAWNYRSPVIMNSEEYRQYQFRKAVQDYWMIKASGNSMDEQLSFIPSINLGGEAFDKVFGSNTINITPTGSAELIFGFNYYINDRPDVSEKLRRTPSFQFDEKILMNVSGSIGEKLDMDFSYNTEATFDFEQKTKLEYAGEEDEILKKIEGGNVTLPLPGSLITGSQSLFGIKTEMQFGKLRVTSVISQQRGESQVIEASGGATRSEFSVTVDEYDANKHFFLSEYFRERYDEALANLPIITSDVTITKIEVWVTNKTSNFEEARNILAVTDIGEATTHTDFFSSNAGFERNPKNELNNALDKLKNEYSSVREISNISTTLGDAGLILGRDFEKIENARLLSDREYELNPKLGYISLNSALNTDEILAVAYEYSYRGTTYRVGEMSTNSGISSPQTLILKLVKPANFTPNAYTWDLMLKNIYRLNAFQVQEEDFTLEVQYRDDKTGNNINYLPESGEKRTSLLRMMNMDRMNSQRDTIPDGVFDYLDGITILPNKGIIIFPVLEPFGSHLEKVIRDNFPDETEDMIVQKYLFQELYDSTKTKAQQIAERNKFILSGTYSSSSSSEIMLNAMNVPEGSVKVIAGGRELVEGTDYRVDYTLGRVTIIDDAILESGTPVKISLENQSLFNFQTKTMVGSHFDYTISENFNVGATILHLTERPLTQKVNIGDEPISNTIWGLNTSYSKPAPLLTTLVDKLPLIETKAPSQLTFVGEFAQLIPGHSRAIAKEGNAYIDDFEGSETSVDLKYYTAWHLASAPQGNVPGADLNNDLAYGYGRAKFAWYQIDRLFQQNRATTPPHIREDPDYQSNPYVYQLYEQDIFPYKEYQNGIPTNISVLNIAYYPQERGPYNYDAENIDSDGKLLDPEDRWGGMMRDITFSDFEASNVEFIEFWLMDPYAGMEKQTGGELYFNLGNISEDILKDSRKMFEDGLPPTSRVEKVDTTVWGRVPLVQSLDDAFQKEEAARIYQDVGLDGLGDEDEQKFFGRTNDDFLSRMSARRNAQQLTEEAFNTVWGDPSSDNYHYYRGSDYDAQEKDILDRYKNYNNPEGNSPSDLQQQEIESYNTVGTSRPDVEDINGDHTLSEAESYYSYRVSMDPEDLQVGRNFIVDKVVHNVVYENEKSDQVTWYQFRIPIDGYEEIYGDISDFKSIRFIRMYLTGFEDTVFLRFAKLELVRGEWRRYNLPFFQGGEDWTGIEPPSGELAISAVNIEENAGKEPVNYTLPPGFTRQIDPSQPQIRQLNEQSILLKVLELGDGDGRAAYKSTDLDMRQYKKIKMEAHAEALIGGDLRDDELAAFLRLGTDYQGNYYEYEVPLKLTPPGKYDNDSEADRKIVWPEENQFDVDLSLFTKVKQERNLAMSDPNSTVTITSVYSIYDDKGNKVSVCGNPNLSSVRTIMIGARNPKKGTNTFIDDGLNKSGEIWLNELRLTDFDENGGWAANGRASARLADFGNITVAGAASTPGFGSIDEKVNERSREQILQYDMSSNFEMGKFFNEEAGVSIPVYFGYSQSLVNPEYNPLDPDIKLREALENAVSDAEREELKRNAQDVVQRKSFALANMRIAPKGSANKTRIYSISNWSSSFSYNEMNSHNPNLDFYDTKKVKANIIYNYSTRPTNVQPFKKTKVLNGKWMKPVKDFNFYYLPSRITFKSDWNRSYLQKQTRNISDLGFDIPATFKHDFNWKVDYQFNFDLTRNVKFDFSASNIMRIDDPAGIYKDELTTLDYFDNYARNVWRDIFNMARTTSYYHSFNLSYTLPVNKIPILDWMTLNTKYTGTYGWDVGPQVADTLGNAIKNSNTFQVNGQMNFVNLYNKSAYLKSINDKYRSNTRGGGRQQKPESEQRTKTKVFEQDKIFLREGSSRYITHNLKTDKITVKMFDENGQEVDIDYEAVTDKRLKISSESSIRNGKLQVSGTIMKGEDPVSFILENSVRMLMAVRTVNVNYNYSTGSFLPGYMPVKDFFGMSLDGQAKRPNWQYYAGWSDDSIPLQSSYRQGLLSTDNDLTDPFNRNSSERLTYRANLEPIKGLRIDVNGNISRSDNHQEFYTYYDGDFPDDSDRYRESSGSFSMSFLSWKSAFEPLINKLDTIDAVSSESFDYLKYKARSEVSERLGKSKLSTINDTLPDYYNGYGPTSQEVLIPAFLAAYGYQDIDKIMGGGLIQKVLKTIPMPNWKVTYDGLGKIEALKKYVNSISINHQYKSTYSVGSYATNPFYKYEMIVVDGKEVEIPIEIDALGNFQVPMTVNTVSISEQFSPLIDLNMDWKNSLTSKFEIRKSRTVGLNMANTQVNEVRSEEYVFGMGYRFNSVPLVLNTRTINSDLNVRLDFSYKNAITVIRKLDDIAGNSITAGQEILTLKATADYMLSEKFTLRAFYDQRINKPHTSKTYNNANYQIGFSLTFTL